MVPTGIAGRPRLRLEKSGLRRTGEPGHLVFPRSAAFEARSGIAMASTGDRGPHSAPAFRRFFLGRLWRAESVPPSTGIIDQAKDKNRYGIFYIQIS